MKSKQTNKPKRINRQKLFLDFLENKLEIKMDEQYGDYVICEREADSDFYIPACKITMLDVITDGHVSYMGNIESNFLRACYGVTYNYDLRLSSEPKIKMTAADTLLLDVFKECKGKLEYLREGEISEALLIIAIKFYDSNNLNDRLFNTRWYSELEKELDNLIEKYSFLDFNKYHDLLATLTPEEQAAAFIKLLRSDDLGSCISDYLKDLEYKKETELLKSLPAPAAPAAPAPAIENNKIISFNEKKESKVLEILPAAAPAAPAPAAKKEIQTNDLFNEQLSFLDIIDSKLLKKPMFQMTIYEA